MISEDMNSGILQGVRTDLETESVIRLLEVANRKHLGLVLDLEDLVRKFKEHSVSEPSLGIMDIDVYFSDISGIVSEDVASLLES